jgi:hypothetical protein
MSRKINQSVNDLIIVALLDDKLPPVAMVNLIMVVVLD